MAHINDIHSIILPASDANFTAHTYTQVYAGAAATPTINGISVTMGAGSVLNLHLKSISATANVYVLGENQDVAQGSIHL